MQLVKLRGCGGEVTRRGELRNGHHGLLHPCGRRGIQSEWLAGRETGEKSTRDGHGATKGRRSRICAPSRWSILLLPETSDPATVPSHGRELDIR